jgi:hypothetical protein
MRLFVRHFIIRASSFFPRVTPHQLAFRENMPFHCRIQMAPLRAGRQIQCVNNPLGASGSSTIRARLFAPEGTSAICKAGLVSTPSHVNFDGISVPS